MSSLARPRSPRPVNTPLILIIGFALLIRLFFFYSVFLQQPQKFDIRDLDGYANIAQNWIHDGVYSREPSAPLIPDFSRPPVYPFFLAGLMVLGRMNGVLITFFQITLGTAAVFCTYLLARELNVGRAASLVAALLTAADPILILLDQYLLSETLFVLEWLFSLWLFVKYLNSKKVIFLTGSAIFFALAALTRPILEFLPLGFIGFILFSTSVQKWKNKARDAAVFTLIFLFLLAPWILRNYTHGTGFTLSDISDTNLYFYRAKAVLADAENLSQEAAYQRLEAELAPIKAASTASPQQIQAFMRSRALEILTSHPIQTIKMTARGAALLLLDPGYSLVCAALDPANLTPECFQGSATMLGGNIFDLMWSRFLTMSLIQKITLIWGTLFMAWLYLGAGTGTILLLKRKSWRSLFVLLGSILYFIALSSGAESLYRLRAPILPLFAILTGLSIDYGYTWCNRRKRSN